MPTDISPSAHAEIYHHLPIQWYITICPVIDHYLPSGISPSVQWYISIYPIIYHHLPMQWYITICQVIYHHLPIQWYRCPVINHILPILGKSTCPVIYHYQPMQWYITIFPCSNKSPSAHWYITICPCSDICILPSAQWYITIFSVVYQYLPNNISPSAQ